jgi:hypothetical protein
MDLRIQLCSIAALSLLIAAGPALAQDKKAVPPPVKKMTEEQKKREITKSCKKEAEDLKLKDKARKSFLDGCLNQAPPEPTAQAKKP